MDNKNILYIFLAVFILLSVSFVFAGVTLVSPADNAIIWGTYKFNATWKVTDAISNMTFWHNRSGSWEMFASCVNLTGLTDAECNCSVSYDTSKIGDGLQIGFNATGYKEKVAGAGQTYKAQGINVKVDIDNTAPSITLEVPANDTWNTSNSVYFAFKVTEEHPLWCNLTIDGANNKSNASAVGNNSRFTYAVTAIGDSSRYLWNVRCKDYPGNTKFASGNFTIKVDATDPNAGSITMPKVTTIYAQRSIKIKCGGSDATSGTDYVKLKITKPSKKTIEVTLDSGKEKTFRGVDTGEAGKYLVDCTVYDVAGNTLSTEQKSFWVYYRTVKSAAPEEEPEEEITPEEEEEEEEEVAEEEEGVPVGAEKAPSKAWIWVLVIVVIILILYFVLKKKK